ncbi:palmitoyltransferase ZDHHC3-like [Capricornis sumatraensis]|uniref:palmitoyltransferase ZDHHC3-like n=1 Tax=Capricornis sumatraensis TaxID=34865 RepID=UPI003604A31D
MDDSYTPNKESTTVNLDELKNKALKLLYETKTNKNIFRCDNVGSGVSQVSAAAVRKAGRWPQSPCGPAAAPRVWLVPDALGIVCASATWALTLSEGALLLSAWLLPAQQPAYSAVHGSLFHLLASLALASHARTMFTDPGALPAGAPPAPGLAGCCPLCGAVRPPGAHHCGVCQRCIRRAHHHCPWVNNCVGEDNRKFFALFALYTAPGALHVLLPLCVPALRAYARGEWDLRAPARLRASLLFLFMVALNGFLFAGLMFTIQRHSILTDPQSQPGEPGQASAWTNLQAVLGPRPSPAWISPFASAGPRAARGPQAVV